MARESRSGEASANCYTPLYFTLLVTVTICVETNCQCNSLEPLDGWHRLAGDYSSETQYTRFLYSLQQIATSLECVIFIQYDKRTQHIQQST